MDLNGETLSELVLDIRELHVSVDGNEIIKGIDLEIKSGEIHAIMGRNGAESPP